jgi:hypothetical protein
MIICPNRGPKPRMPVLEKASRELLLYAVSINLRDLQINKIKGKVIPVLD